MKLTCDKNVLNKSINIAINAINTKTTQNLLKCFLLKAYNNKFVIIANDLKLAIETSNIESNIMTDGEILIDAKIFSDIVKKLPSGDVLIYVDSDNFVNIIADRSEFKIQGLETSEFPAIPTIEKNRPVIIKGSIFSNMINRTIFSVAMEDIKPILTGELIDIENNELNVVAIDGFRVAHMKHTIEKPCENMHIVVPSKSLDDISKILNEEEEILIFATDKHLLVESSKATILTRLLEGDFMEYRKIFTEDHTCKINALRGELLDCLERSMLVAREGKRTPVKFIISETKLIIKSNSEKGNSIDEIFITKDGEDLTIAFNPKYVIDVLKAIDDENITIQFTNALSPCIVKGCTNEAYRFLILPLRLKG